MMTLYELNDLSVSYQARIAEDFTIYISLVSAFLVVAYLVGQKLTRFQVVAISVMFILTASINIVSMAIHLARNRALQVEIAAISGDAPIQSMATIVGIPIVLAVGPLLALLFMRNVRSGRVS